MTKRKWERGVHDNYFLHIKDDSDGTAPKWWEIRKRGPKGNIWVLFRSTGIIGHFPSFKKAKEITNIILDNEMKFC